MREQDYAVHHGQQVEQQEISKVLRNTYSLLALTLAFSGVMAFVAQQMRVGYPNVFVVLIGFYGLFFLTNKLRDSAGPGVHLRPHRLHGLHSRPDPQPLPGHGRWR